MLSRPVPLVNAEYVVSAVALGVDEYYAGVGEAPGVWCGRWAPELGLVGMVEADDLRRLIDGMHPTTGEPLVSGRKRAVQAFDLTFSAPKSVSVAWALGDPRVHHAAMAAHVAAVDVAVRFLEDRTAVTRQQEGRVRRRVGTAGFVMAGFVHRTSRAGDPQLHTHVVLANLVKRATDGRVGAFDATPLHVWRIAAGTIYQNEIQRQLTAELGVGWAAARSNTREMAGMDRGWLRAFSQRTEQIEVELAATGHDDITDRRLRMAVDDEAALTTRPAKDHSLTPTGLADQWAVEAAAAGVPTSPGLLEVMRRPGEEAAPRPSRDVMRAGLIDPTTGLCANEPRFTEADVFTHLAALSAGRFSVKEIATEVQAFLDSTMVVRLTAKDAESVPLWSTAAHRALEDRVLAHLDHLQTRPEPPILPAHVEAALAASPHLAMDQVGAAELLCESGRALAVVLAPAGYGKTSMVHAAAMAAALDGQPVLGVATTAKAAAELTGAGVPSVTIARLRLDLQQGPLPAGTIVILDEVSQTSTLDADTVLTAVNACRAGRLWVLGDARQGRSVLAGGLAVELQCRADAGLVPSAALTVNRRQQNSDDRGALQALRAGNINSSVATRTANGWEHTACTPEQVREDLADAVADDIAAFGASGVVALTVSHGDAEDLADRIRARLADEGHIAGPAMTGPGWTADREYRAGDRVLLHGRCGERTSSLVNGTTATITAVTPDGVTIRPDHDPDRRVALAAAWVQGSRRDGSPNLSHGWARTIDGAQGGTWEQAHLLGTAALDTYRGYVGQSRSRQPTHTWNTQPTSTAQPDVAGITPTTAPAEESVAAALSREPDASMAATDDPHVLDRSVRAVITEHLRVLHDRPRQGVTPEAAAARLVAAEKAAADWARLAALRERELVKASGIRRLTSHGRFVHRTYEGYVSFARSEVQRTASDVTDGRQALAAAQANAEALRRFDAEHGWRDQAVTQLRSDLANHWTDTILHCTRNGELLAQGAHRLQEAAAVTNRRLWGLLSDQGSTDQERMSAKADRDLLQSALDDRLPPPAQPEIAVSVQRGLSRSLDLGIEL